MKNILFLSVMNGAPWGGSEELWYRAALSCTGRGINTAVCCFNWDEKKQKLKTLKDAGCKLYLLPGKQETKKQLITAKGKLIRTIASIPFEDFDLVIVNQGGWKDIAYSPFQDLYKRLREYVLLFHNYNLKEKFSSGKQNSLQQWVYGAKKNLGASLKIFHAMEDRYKMTVPRQQKLFNPLTITMDYGEQEKYPLLQNGNYIFSVLAALDIERKAQDVLIHSLSYMKWKERNWELHFYGEGKDKSLLEKLVAKLKMGKKILIHGNAKDYKKALSDSHLVLQLTHIDAMPITVIEAMAMAKPLVVSAVGDMPVWVKENENGWISEKVNTASILQTMEKAWNKREDWKKMGEKSLQVFKKNFPENPVDYFLKQVRVID